MFSVILPSQRGTKADLLSKIFATREGLRDDFDTDSTIYIAYELKDWGIFASARLNLLAHSPAADFYAKKYTRDECAQMMEVSLISFDMEGDHDNEIAQARFDRSIVDFYEGLYQVLLNMGISQVLRGVTSLSFIDDFEDLTFFGKWRFFAYDEVSLGEDPYVVGLLATYSEQPPVLKMKDRVA